MGIYFPEKSFATRGIYYSRMDFQKEKVVNAGGGI